MTGTEKKIVARLEKIRDRLGKQVVDAGGRGVELSEHYDRVNLAILSLRGELQCPHCDVVLADG